ncbi:MAG: bifunctional tRNA (5-methylaminomethyl-2-thiouridine)(34)-methyltransferase MnmD/FAD-dependent 5-carboxymethylaminomethyl-2-thiouridine(34) oxidoreductase MnmC [Kordiimonas sp.]
MIKQTDKIELSWRGNAPVSSKFDDVYYSEENGLEETEFVFLKGIGAPDCWQNKDSFVIAETGFGTGLNFLVTYRDWISSGAKGQLTFISVEKYPLTAGLLREAHKSFPEIREYSKELCSLWPPASEGIHERIFRNGKVRLLLVFGDASTAFSEVHASVDAWFLDGFAPAKNPEMWTDDLFNQIDRLSHSRTSFATFTAAGFVKRALAAKGFNVKKTPGYGRKRERLVGLRSEEYVTSSPCKRETRNPEWASIPTPNITTSTIVIGAGIAGSCIARELNSIGHNVTLVSSNEPAGSDVPAAILSPGFQRSDQPAARFATACFIHACGFPYYNNAWAGERGVRLSTTEEAEKARLQQIADKFSWGSEWLIPEDDGYFLPKSGSLHPATALLKLQKGIKHIKSEVSQVKYVNNQWHVTADNEVLTADNVVVACAMESDLLLPDSLGLDLRPKPGQIEVINAAAKNMPQGNHAYGGYVTAAIENPSSNHFRTIGSTFEVQPENGREWPLATQENRMANLSTLEENTGSAPLPQEIIASWAGLRATTPDYMPYVGPVPDWIKAAEQFKKLAKDRKLRGLGPMPYQKGLYLMTGFGAKGFQQAPLCASYIAALIDNRPLPIATSLIPYLHPARHMIKSIVRGTSL